MNKKHQAKIFAKKATALVTVFGMAATLMPAVPMQVKAADFTGTLTEVKAVDVDTKDKNIVWVTFNNDVRGKITFLDDGIFRYNVDPSGEFSKYAVANSDSHMGRIQQYPDESEKYSHPDATVTDADGYFTVKSGNVSILFDKDTGMMSIKNGDKTVMEEKASLSIGENATVQTLKKQDGENFYGGGTQNGRFVHTGEAINIANESNWVDGGVASPNPFYYTTDGYGVLRNTFKPGNYNFGKAQADTVTARHNENEFDAYYFVSGSDNGREVTQEILQEYFKVTGNPALLPEYAFYTGHLNAYNRDSWSDESGGKAWTIKGIESAKDANAGTTTYESGMSTGYVLQPGMHAESLNGEGPQAATKGTFPDNVDTPYKYSARAVIDNYVKYDMPLGFFLPNDGYGAGYGQNGYYQTGGVNADGTSSAERIAAVDANVANLKSFADYAASKGVATGLWTQSYLSPDSNSDTSWHLLRDFRKEVGAGVTTLKTDVAWVGHGYSMQLDGVKTAYDTATSVVNTRPNIISLDGWAGSQRYNSIWSGDQTGGNWEYIRFHIPTYIGTSLSGNPNLGSDMDGIFGGSALITTRDYQWKTFTQEMLNMDGWGSYAKMPFTFGDPYTGINRMYLKLKSTLMPYLYTSAYSASNIDTGNNDTGLPMIRAMFLEYPNDDYAYSKNMQYQYMFGKNVLVAPVYQNTKADAEGNDVRDNIYLPDENQIWIDFFTGKQYQGGRILNNYDAPLWKLPAFVKNGAIIPQYEANNSPTQINKANRIVEFWPAGESNYTAVEDDGTYLKNDMTTDEEYGVIDNISYGTHVSTKYTSKVEGTTATLTAEKSTGSYTGYQKDKNTTFVVHVSKEPTSITAKNGDAALTPTKVTSKEDFDKAVAAAGTAVWFYDAAPQIETYASEEETEFKALVADVKVAPKLYVKFAAADAQAADQTLVINGFENDGGLEANKPNSALSVPVLTENEAAKTPTSLTVNWTAVDGATAYDLKVDGRLNAVDGGALTYTYTDLEYSSEHTFQVRAKNADGYSEWSEEQTFVTDFDPWRNTPDPVSVDWTGQIWGSHTADLAFDKIFQTADGGFHSNYGGLNDLLTVDYGKAYQIDKIEYYPRDDGGNGTVTRMRLETSLDGNHWTQIGEYDWTNLEEYPYAAMKTMQVDKAARYIRFTALASRGGWFSASEIKVCTKEGDKGFALGSTNLNQEVTDGDYTNMKNYLGTSVKDGSNFVDQIQKRYGDINDNGYYDVYDYAFTMFQLDGGTKKDGKLGGKSVYETSAKQVAAGENFTVTFKADGVIGVNALGQIIPYDPNKVEFVSVAGSEAIAQMEDLCVPKNYGDGTAYVNIAFANRGDKDLYKGSDTLVTLTMKAKENISTDDADVIGLHGLIMIAPDYSTNGEIGEEPEALIREFVRDDFDITMTNAVLTEDDGTNVEKMIQYARDYGYLGYGYDMLFNGKLGREFEYLWDNEDNYDETGSLPAYITLPLTMHFTLKEPAEMGKFILYNANKANGYVTAASAKANYTDGTSMEQKIRLSSEKQTNYSTFTFEEIFVPGKKVQSVDLTIQKAIAQGGADTTRLLTLAEVQAFGRDPLEVIEAPEKIGTDKFDMTMTNAELTEDDGSNIARLIQGGSYDKLFDGSLGRDFEFLWDTEDNWDESGYLPSYVTLPVTMHFTMKDVVKLNKLVVYNANKANGYVTSVTADVFYKDGTFATQDITLSASEQVNNAAFTFEDLFAAGKEVDRVDVTLNKAIAANGEETLNMLTLAEVELFGETKKEEEPTLYLQNEMDLTITNEALPEDDGTNVEKLIQNNSFDGLFNGSLGRDFELKWTVTDVIKLPVTLHLTLKNPGTVSSLVVYNANKANGYVTQVSAKVNYEDGSSEEKVIELTAEEQKDYATFNFEDLFNKHKVATSVDVTALKAISGSGAETTNMLTLGEIQLFRGGSVEKSDIEKMKDIAVIAQKAALSAESAQKAAETAQTAAEEAEQAAKAAQAEAEAAEGRANEAATKSAAAQAAAEAARSEAQAAQAGAVQNKEAAEQAAARAEVAEAAAKQAKADADTAVSQAEAAKTAADDARAKADTARTQAESAKSAAEAAKTAAETARDAAKNHANDAEKAKTAAETARQQANAAKADAEAAKDAAMTAKNDVDNAKKEAESSRQKADAAASSAAAQADLAKASADAARLSAEAAAKSAKEAEEKLKEAEELIKKAQAEADAKLAEMKNALQAEANAQIAQMRSALELEQFKNTKVKVKSVKGQSGKAKVTWNTVSGAEGYQIAYSQKSSMKGGKKVTVTGQNKASKVIKKLAAKKTWYVRVRAYKTVNGSRVYTQYSAKKSARVK